MFRSRVIIAGAAALSLASCASLPSGGLDPGITDQIQAYTLTACAFVPTAVTIAAIINANSASLSKAADIAAAICAAVAPIAPKMSTAGQVALNTVSPLVPRVAGVPIQGYFVHT